jgi:DNA-binding transcriptional ArsR family regulator
MGISKSHHFNERQNKLAAFTKAFAHPARVAIIEQIIAHKACIMGSLAEKLPLSPSTISQHLKELKSAGIIKGDIEGPSVCYCIDEKNWQQARALINDFFTDIDRNCC